MQLIPEKKVTVIVPVYNTYRYLSKCLDSALQSSYKNLEIIVVDDCSPDDSKKIIDEYMQRDTRIKYVKHEKNTGLLSTRFTGYKHATGDYITFLDSDDYVAPDTYRQLVKTAVSEDSDITCCNFKSLKEDTGQFSHLLIDQFSDELISGSKILEAFHEHKGVSSKWTVLWNKLYSMSLFEKVYKHFESFDRHIIMAEDLCISSFIFFYAQKLAAIPYQGIIYNRNEGSSTAQRTSDISKYEKYIEDTVFVYDYVLDFYKKNNVPCKIIENILASKERAFRYWCKTFSLLDITKQQKDDAVSSLKQSFSQVNEGYPTLNDDFSYTYVVECNEIENQMQKKIVSDTVKCVAFDLFGVLVNDVFSCQDDFNSVFSSIDKSKYPSLFMKREYGKNLYELACDIGKKIIIIGSESFDMSTHKKILQDNGYSGYADIAFEYSGSEREDSLYFKSSDDKETNKKNTIVVPNTINNFYEKRGIRSLCDIHTNGAVNFDSAYKDRSFRYMLKLIANRFEDNPFDEAGRQSFFGGDLYAIGYAALGTYLAGVVDWIFRTGQQHADVQFLDCNYKIFEKAYKIYAQNKNDIRKIFYDSSVEKIYVSYDGNELDRKVGTENRLLILKSTNNIDFLRDHKLNIYHSSCFLNSEIMDFCFIDDHSENYIRSQIKQKMFKGALDFVSDYSKGMSNINSCSSNPVYSSYFMMFFINYTLDLDRKAFEHLDKDLMPGEFTVEEWKRNIADQKIVNYKELDKYTETYQKVQNVMGGKFKKALYLWMTDKNIFISKIKNILKR